MSKTELAPGIIHYAFPPRRETHSFGDSIVAIIDGNNAMLIDVGYEDEAQQVIDDLSARCITIDKIIISHFHADHLFGIHLLPGVPFYGGIGYKETLVYEKTPDEEMEKYIPSVAVDKPMILEFGSHKLELIPFPGHSECTMLTKINGRFLHIADEVVFSVDGRLSLPYLCNGEKNVKRQRQLASWAKLKDYSEFTIIPAHGPAFDGDELQGYLRNLNAYLDVIIESDGKVTYEEAVKSCDYPLLHSNWHEFNCK